MQTATTRSGFRLLPILFLILVSSLSGARAFQEGVLITAADLDAYLAQKGSPMVGEGAHYLKWGQYFNVDPRLVIAISGAESTFGQKPCGNQFNVWGWKPEGECWAGFEPGLDADTNQPQFQNAPGFVPGKGITMETGYEDGIFWVTENVRRGYLDQGLNTVAQIAPKWCQEGCENWVPNVERFMQEMGGDPNHLLFPQENPEASDGTIMPIEGLSYSEFPSDSGEPKRTDDPRSWYSTVYRGKYDGHWTTRGEGSGSHPGVDIRVESGTPVRAIADGIVDARITINATGTSDWGGLIVLRHDNLPNTTEPVYSIYAHLREWYVNKGGVVRKGNAIGKSGGDPSDPYHGKSDGPHLHFQIDRDTVNSDGKTVFTSPWSPTQLNPPRSMNTPDTDHTVEQYTYHPIQFILERTQDQQYLYAYTKQYPDGWISLQVNEVLEVEIDYQNTGTTTWANTGGLTNMNYIELRSVDKNGVQVDSALFHESFIDRQRVGSYLALQRGVAPGQIARFVFKIRVNASHFAPGDAKFVYFRPYHATGGWMPESDWGQVHLKIRIGNDLRSANLFQINGKVLNADGSLGKNGLFVVVMNTSDSQRVAKDTTGSFAGDGRYVVTFFDPNAPVARTDDLFEVTVMDPAGHLLAQKEQRLTEADIQTFTTSIDVKLKPTPTGQIGANLFSISGTVYTADGDPVEDGFTVTVQNTSKLSLVATTTTGAVTGDGGYIVTFFNLAEPVAEAGDVVEITVKDIAGNPFAQRKQTLTEADVKALGVTIDLTQQTGLPLETVLSPPSDVNTDGVVNVFDLVQVASQFGQSGARLNGDVNGDGVVNVFDLVLIGSHLGGGAVAAAPSAEMNAPVTAQLTVSPNVERLRCALVELEKIPQPSHGVEIAQQMLRAWLADVVPISTETKLFPNYPNPFNPETWIPYQLAHDAEVTITIYDTRGTLVRRLNLGHQKAGYYQDRGSAAYWDGRNEAGELVSSGVYFSQLRAGDFTAVLRMVILK